MNEKPKLILVCGPPCSGKSTWIKNNNPENLPVLSTDSFIEKEAENLGKTYNEIFESTIKSAVNQLSTDLKEYSSNKKSFIVDQTNLYSRARNKKLVFCKDYYKIAVYFEVPLEIILERNKQRQGKVIPKYVIENMMLGYRRPTKEEGYDLIIDGTTNQTVHKTL